MGEPWSASLNLPLKHIFSKDLEHFIKSMESPLFFRQKEIMEKYPLTADFILEYLVYNTKITELKRAAEVIEQRYQPELGDNIMTLGQRLKKQGFSQGVKQGIEQGIEQGQKKTMYKIAQNLLDDGLSMERIAHYLRIPEHKVAMLLSSSNSPQKDKAH